MAITTNHRFTDVIFSSPTRPRVSSGGHVTWHHETPTGAAPRGQGHGAIQIHHGWKHIPCHNQSSRPHATPLGRPAGFITPMA